MADDLTRPASGRAGGDRKVRNVRTALGRGRKRDRDAREAQDEQAQMPLVEHLRELRGRMLKAVVALVPGTVLGAFIYRDLAAFLVEPVCDGATIRADGTCPPLTQVGLTAPLTTAIMLSFATGFMVAAPVILYQAWAFVTPALYRHEKRWTLAFLCTAVPFFFAGAALCYLIMPNAVRILLNFGIGEAAEIVDLNDYLNIFIRLILVFGLAFQTPVFMVLLSAAGLLPARAIRRHWRPIVLGVFLFAAIATPTGDPFTMLALAVPLCLLIVVAYGFALLFDRRRARRSNEPDYSAYDDDETSDLDDDGTSEPADDQLVGPVDATLDATLDELEGRDRPRSR